MAIVNPRIHIICGICGSNKDFSYSTYIEQDDEIEGKENTKVNISCANCSSLTEIEEVINKK